MTRDEVIRRAREVGMQGISTYILTTLDDLHQFADACYAAGAAAEREACAKEVETESQDSSRSDVAAAIRARGEK